MTLRMYADRKKWALTAVEVTLSHSRIHTKDCEDCETEKGMLDEIKGEITLAGELDDTQRERLMEIAHRCPLHRTMTRETTIRWLEK